MSEARKSYEAEQAQKKREAYERAQQAKAQEAAAKAAAKAAAAPKPTGYEQAEKVKERAQTPRDSSGKFV